MSRRYKGLLDNEPEEIQVQRAQRFEQEALVRIFERHFDVVYAFVAARVGNPVDAEDLSAQVFLVALDSLPQYRYRGSSLGTWLRQIASALVASHLERLGAGQIDVLSEPGDDPAMRRHLVRQSLAGLRPDEQAVLTTRLLAGDEPEEIAAAGGLQPSAYQRVQHQALRRLRNRLRHLGVI